MGGDLDVDHVHAVDDLGTHAVGLGMTMDVGH